MLGNISNSCGTGTSSQKSLGHYIGGNDLFRIIENLDDLEFKADNIKMTRHQYLDALRAVN